MDGIGVSSLASVRSSEDSLFTPLARRIRAPLIGAALALLATCAAAGSPPEARPSRLSGIMVAGDELKVAVFEFADGTNAFFALGDTVPGWGRITEVLGNGVRLVTLDGSSLTILATAGGPRSPLQPEPAAAPEPRIDMASQMRVQASAGTAAREVYGEIVRLSADKQARAEDLSDALGAILELPPSARVVAVNHQPVSPGNQSARALKSMLDQGSTVRVSLEGVDGVDAVYLSPPRPGAK